MKITNIPWNSGPEWEDSELDDDVIEDITDPVLLANIEEARRELKPGEVPRTFTITPNRSTVH